MNSDERQGTAANGHEPRERPIQCRRMCGNLTLNYHAVCDTCGPVTCERCAPPERAQDPSRWNAHISRTISIVFGSR